MNLNDINETVLVQMPPETVKAIIEAQMHSETLQVIGGTAGIITIALLFWVFFKYS